MANLPIRRSSLLRIDRHGDRAMNPWNFHQQTTKHMSDFTLPKKGFVHWPVGNGDSTTVVVRDNELVMQVDLKHMEKSEDEGEPTWPVIDHLVRTLPKKNGKPYLAVFALTHPDKDHIQGFEELNKKVLIGELWHTPRVFRDYEENATMCEDALAFRKEAHRRANVMKDKGTSTASGDRVRVIGHDDIMAEEPYRSLPQSARTTPGTSVTELDGVDVSATFNAFIHSPFKEDQDADRNDTSLTMHIRLVEGSKDAQALLFGDIAYKTLRVIYDKTKERPERGNEKYLEWDILLAPHHCSKAAMYVDDVVKEDILDDFREYKRSDPHIVASCHHTFDKGDLPPHRKARNRYEEVVDKTDHFICTQEYPTKKETEPVVFELDAAGLKLRPTETKREDGAKGGAAAGISHKEQVVFGQL